MRGRKPSDPKIKALAEGKLGIVATDDTPRQLYPAAPAWISDPVAKAEWARVIPDLIRRKKYLNLFEVELGRYCVAFGIYVRALEEMRVRGGKLQPITSSSKDVPMYSPHWVVANRANEQMQKLAGDLGLNPVAYQRIENLQLDLFADPAEKARDQGGTPAAATPFGAFRRGA